MAFEPKRPKRCGPKKFGDPRRDSSPNTRPAVATAPASTPRTTISKRLPRRCPSPSLLRWYERSRIRAPGSASSSRDASSNAFGMLIHCTVTACLSFNPATPIWFSASPPAMSACTRSRVVRPRFSTRR